MGSNPEFVAKRSESTQKHGHKKRSGSSVEYKTWLAIKRRCYDSNFKDFPNWGGRGIRVCDRWKDSFLNFLEDMGSRPNGRYSIDRLDPDGDYAPENCRWATIQQNSSENCRHHVAVNHNGIRYHSLAAACRALGVPLSRTRMRISAGYSLDEALSPNKKSRWG